MMFPSLSDSDGTLILKGLRHVHQERQGINNNILTVP